MWPVRVWTTARAENNQTASGTLQEPPAIVAIEDLVSCFIVWGILPLILPERNAI